MAASVLGERFSRHVKNERKFLRMTQAQFAVLVGLSHGNDVGRYELGKIEPALAMIERFAKALGKDPLEMLQPLDKEQAVPQSVPTPRPVQAIVCSVRQRSRARRPRNRQNLALSAALVAATKARLSTSQPPLPALADDCPGDYGPHP